MTSPPFFVHQRGSKRSAHGACCLSPRHHQAVNCKLDAKLRAIADACFDAVEIFENDLLTAPQTACEIGVIMTDLGLACSIFQPFRDLEGMPEPLPTRALDRMERKFDVLGKRAATRGLRVGDKALAWGRHVNDHRDAWSLVRDVDPPAIGLVLDSFHSLSRNLPSSSIGDTRPDKLFIVQLADAPLLDMDHLNWSRHFRAMPGQGDFALAEFAAAIRKIGYQGYWSLEVFNDRFRAGSSSLIARDGHRSLRLLEDDAARLLRQPTPMPPRVAPHGVEFIEFAARHEEAEQFGRMFAALGFAPVAHYRSRDVTRWVQGSSNLAINSEPEGLAHSFDVVHGGSVCALGLAVDDQSAAMARAEAQGIAVRGGGGPRRVGNSVAAQGWGKPALFRRCRNAIDDVGR